VATRTTVIKRTRGVAELLHERFAAKPKTLGERRSAARIATWIVTSFGLWR
jgi:hypothetical protein